MVKLPPMNFVRSLTLGLTLLAFAGRPAVAADPLPPLLVDEAGQPIKSATGWAKWKSALRAEWQTFLGEFPKEKAPLKAEVLANIGRAHV